MDNSRFPKITHIADLIICSVLLLLVAHEEISGWMINPFILLFPAVRIWISFLIKRQSKLMIVPIVVLALLTSCMFLDRSPRYLLFVGPWETFLTSVCALFSIDSVHSIELQELVGNVCKNILSIVGYIWLVIYPLAVYIYKRSKKQLAPGTMGIWKCIGLCAYIFGCTIVSSIVLSVSYKTTIGMAVLAFMLMLIPSIFYRNNIKEMFMRGEVAYLLTLAIFAVGYVCGIGLELKSAITVCTLPAAFFALMNRYIRRETAYKDILLIVGASVVFWCAQYTTNMVRILLLFTSLAMMAIPIIRFAIDTKKNWASAGLYVMIALVMPVFCLGYNPYSVLEASRAWHFDKYYGSPDGILCVRAGDTGGLRDRYGVILPVDKYNRIELLTPSKPYCKVGKDGKWQIYDIERQELVSDEWFEDVIPCDEYVYRLKTQNGDKYLSLRWYYNPDGEQTARIVDEMPVKMRSNDRNKQPNTLYYQTDHIMEKKKMIINGHEAVDLGLSVKWATCNIGASNPEEYGDYFAFGETEPKDEYTEENYMLYGIPHGEAYIDIGKIISGTEYDAASKQWGDDWRMPTEEELYELLSFCSWQWMTINGVNGYKVIGPNGNSIFLPAAGTFNSEHNECGCYWTGSFSDEDCHWDALNLQFDENYHYSNYAQPDEGLVIRPVTKLIDFGRRFSLYYKTNNKI